MKNDFIFELPQMKASVATTCDGCGCKLGDSYPRMRGSISLELPDGKDDGGYDKYKRGDFCGLACLKAYLNKEVTEDDKD